MNGPQARGVPARPARIVENRRHMAALARLVVSKRLLSTVGP